MKLLNFQEESVAKLADAVDKGYKSGLIADDMEGFPIQLFLSKYEEDEDGCWIWQAALGGAGDYGIFTWVKNGKRITKPAHVWSYKLFKGPIPDGLEVDHLCRKHPCGNPDCLEAVTHQVNQKRGLNGNKTHCKHNHEFTEENTYINTRGQRECKACRREAVRRRNRRLRGEVV